VRSTYRLLLISFDDQYFIVFPLHIQGLTQDSIFSSGMFRALFLLAKLDIESVLVTISAANRQNDQGAEKYQLL